MKTKILTLYRRYLRIIPGIRSYLLISIIVFLLGVAITIFSWYIDHQRIESLRRDQVNEQLNNVTSDITTRLKIYEQELRGASGLFSSSNDVTAEEWERFIQSFSADKSYPGVSGFAYAAIVNQADVEQFNASQKEQLKTNFTIHPAGTRSTYTPITYIEPLTDNGRKALGFDVATDETRRNALDHARDSGDVTLTNRIYSLIDPRSPQIGFSLYYPVYNNDTIPKTTEERRDDIQGYVFAGFRANNFFSQVINQQDMKAYAATQIFDGKTTDRNSLLYETTDFQDYDQNKLSQPYAIKVFDHDWTFRFAGPTEISKSDRQRSNMILIGGLTLTAAVSASLFLIMLLRARDIVYAKQQEAQQAKDDLLSLASHQLRTPATAVKQYLGMILEGYTGEVNKDQLPALQKAYSSNERQLETINKILYVAKADAGRLSINRNYFDLNFLVDDIALDLGDQVEEKGQKIVIDRSDKKLKVYADEPSLRMVIENLITNASKYSYEKAKISVKTGSKDGDAYISVKDKGVGIAPDDFEKLFKKFSRIDNDLSLQVGGSGIGLYIDKVLIELHGGRIVVESELGSGSTFTIFIPKDGANNLTDGTEKDVSI